MTYLPSKFPVDPPIQISNQGGYHIATGSGGQQTVPLYTDRIGRWMFYVSMTGNLGTNEDGPTFNIAVRLNGGNQSAPTKSLRAYSGNDMNWGYAYYADMAASTQWYTAWSQSYFVSGDIAVYQYLFFVPTAAYPR
jgi:hypothetical protein